MRLLNRLREYLIIVANLKFEEFSVGRYALIMEALEDERNGFRLTLAPALEIDTEAGELVGTVARAEAELESAIAQDIDKGGVLDDAHRMMQWHDHHGGAELDARGLGRKVSQVSEGIGQYTVFIRKMVFGACLSG